MLTYTDEFPESDWTLGSVYDTRSINIIHESHTEIPADVDAVTLSKLLTKFVDGLTIPTSDVEELLARTKKQVPKKAVVKLTTVNFSIVDSYYESYSPHIECRVWYYVPKTASQKKNFLKQQEVAARRQLAAAERKKADEAAKEAAELKLYAKLKKKYG